MNALNTKNTKRSLMFACMALILILVLTVWFYTDTPGQEQQVVEKEVELSNGAVVLCLIIHTEHGKTMSCDWQRAVPPKTANPHSKVL